MSAGLPAFGLGGLFYLLLVIWMVLRACSGGGVGASQWAFIGKMSLMGIIMVAVIVGELALFRTIIDILESYIPSLKIVEPANSWQFMIFFYLIPFLLLAMIISLLHITRLAMSASRLKMEALNVNPRAAEAIDQDVRD